jgi:hypothetical protein
MCDFDLPEKSIHEVVIQRRSSSVGAFVSVAIPTIIFISEEDAGNEDRLGVKMPQED